MSIAFGRYWIEGHCLRGRLPFPRFLVGFDVPEPRTIAFHFGFWYVSVTRLQVLQPGHEPDVI